MIPIPRFLHARTLGCLLAAFCLLAGAPLPAAAQSEPELPGSQFIELQLKKYGVQPSAKRKQAAQVAQVARDEATPPPLPSRNRLRGSRHRQQVISTRQQQLQQHEAELKQRAQKIREQQKQLRRQRLELRRMQREARKRRRELRRMQRRQKRELQRAKRLQKTANRGNASSTISIQSQSRGAALAPKAQQPAEPGAALKSELPPLPIRRPHRHPSKIRMAAWSEDMVSKAKAECVSLLSRVDIKALPLPPSRKGQCGAPAPVLLTHISRTDSIEIKPAATLSCRMVAGLARWLQEDVQPLAKKHLGTRVTRIRNVSSYVCRRRYSAANTRISEHAYANALDIAAFELKNGQRVSVLDHWNDESEGRSAFLHALHKSACKRFGTVLGPEANAAHKDHFHLDMKPRRRSNYCQ